MKVHIPEDNGKTIFQADIYRRKPDGTSLQSLLRLDNHEGCSKDPSIDRLSAQKHRSTYTLPQ